MKIPLYGTTVNGKPVFDNPAYAQHCFAEYEGKRFLITLEKEVNKVSLKQHHYYRGVVLEAIWLYLHDAGNQNSRSEVHAMLAYKFLMDNLIGAGGEIIGEYIRSTADLSDSEMYEFTEQCRQWAAEVLHIDIKNPDKEYGRKRL
jgi:hypothetical protein